MEIETLKRLRLAEDDIVVLKASTKLSPAQIDRLYGVMSKVLDAVGKPMVQIIILDDDIDVEVLGREEEEEEEPSSPHFGEA